MRMPWRLDGCILCLDGTRPLTSEHLIPECIGGHLEIPFLCGTCNADLGTRLDAVVPTDPRIVLAARNLQNRIPIVVAPILERQLYSGHGEGPSVRGRVRNDAFQALEQRMADGSIVQPTSRARRSVETILLRQGHERGVIEEALTQFDAAGENTRVPLTESLEIVNWRTDRIELLLGGSLIGDLLPLKIAYEFLALHLYSEIYRRDSPLEEIRLSLRGSLQQSDAWYVEHRHASYEPFHGIAMEQARPHAIVQIRLFGWLAFKVEFPRLAFEGLQGAYTHRLDSGVENWTRVGS